MGWGSMWVLLFFLVLCLAFSWISALCIVISLGFFSRCSLFSPVAQRHFLLSWVDPDSQAETSSNALRGFLLLLLLQTLFSFQDPLPRCPDHWCPSQLLPSQLPNLLFSSYPIFLNWDLKSSSCSHGKRAQLFSFPLLFPHEFSLFLLAVCWQSRVFLRRAF